LRQNGLEVLGGVHHDEIWLSNVRAEATALPNREFPRTAAWAESTDDELATSGRELTFLR